MSVRGSNPAVPPRGRPNVEKFQFGPWTVTASQSHILQSDGPERDKFESQLDLPQVPEMIFADNILRIQHSEGYGIEFNSLDALKLVDAHSDPLKVAVSEAWKEARADCEHIKEVVKPFDWTYTTDYKGTVFGKDHAQIKVVPTEERIDLEKLKVKEKILFYQDIVLFEDELADNGESKLSIKLRVMPSSFFLLLRLYLRVDNVIIRVNDTRVYHEAGKNYMLREFTSKDNKVQDIQAPLHILTDQNEISQYLILRQETFEKLQLPEVTSADPKTADEGVR